MKIYRHFKVQCLACGSVWEEDFADQRTTMEVKAEIVSCEDCGNDLIQVSGIEKPRTSKK